MNHSYSKVRAKVDIWISSECLCLECSWTDALCHQGREIKFIHFVCVWCKDSIYITVSCSILYLFGFMAANEDHNMHKYGSPCGIHFQYFQYFGVKVHPLITFLYHETLKYKYKRIPTNSWNTFDCNTPSEI